VGVGDPASDVVADDIDAARSAEPKLRDVGVQVVGTGREVVAGRRDGRCRRSPARTP